VARPLHVVPVVLLSVVPVPGGSALSGQYDLVLDAEYSLHGVVQLIVHSSIHDNSTPPLYDDQ
jgi:hypothetical protein